MNCCIIEYAALGPSKQHQIANSTVSVANKSPWMCVLNTRSTFAIEWQNVYSSKKKPMTNEISIIFGMLWFSNRSSSQHIYSVHIFGAGQIHDISRQVELYATLLFILFLLVFLFFFFFHFVFALLPEHPLVNHFVRQIRMIDNYSNPKCFVIVAAKSEALFGKHFFNYE